MSEETSTITEAIDAARQRGSFVVAVMSAERDAVSVTSQTTAGVNLAIGCAVLVKQTVGRLDRSAERDFLERFLKELRS